MQKLNTAIKILLIALGCLFISFTTIDDIMGQTGTVSGTITDRGGETLPGVNVSITIQARTLGASSDVNGEYIIENVPVGIHNVRAQFIGLAGQTREVTVEAGETATLNFELRRSTLQLDELVVTGAGASVERERLGHSIASVNMGDLAESSLGGISEALVGRVPGVVTMPSGGMLSEAPNIRIRGSSSLSMTNEPLVYIDGVRIESRGGYASGIPSGGGGQPSRLASIDVNSIERMEILKGPAAATLYGSQASAGVIQIFTKQGSQDQAPEFDFEIQNHLVQLPSSFKTNAGWARTQEQANNINQVYGLNVSPYEAFEANSANDLFGNGWGQTYSGSVRGGGNSVTYYSALRYTSMDGPWNPSTSTFMGQEPGPVNDEIRRLHFTGNLNIIASENLRIRLSSMYTNAYQQVPASNITIYNPIALAQYAKPETANPNNVFGNPFFGTVREGTFWEIEDASDHGRVIFSANYLFSDNIIFDASFGVDYLSQRSQSFRPFGWNVDGVSSFNTSGNIDVGNREIQEWTFESKLNWTTDISSNFASTFVTGVQGFRRAISETGAFGVNFPGPGLQVVNAASTQNASSSFMEVINAGLFAQEQLSYKDFLYFTAGARLDASSAFGSDFNTQLYPKLSVALMPYRAFNFQIPGVSTLRLRAAIGQSGQQPGAFDSFTTFLPFRSPEGPGLSPGNLGNPDLAPEISTEWEVGAEVGVLNDQLSLDITYWDRVTNDALINRNFAPSGGFFAPQLDNIGELIAKGLEMGIQANVIERTNFGLQMNVGASYTYEQVTDMGGAPTIAVGGTYIRHRSFIKEGYAPGAFFGTKLPDGILFPLDLEQNGTPSSQSALLNFFSQPRNPTELNNFVMVAGPNGEALPGGETYLETYLGKPTPDWQGAFGFNMRYSNFNLRTNFEYRAGNYFHQNLTDGFRRSNPGIGRNIIESATLEATMMNPATSPEERMEAGKQWINEMLALSPFDGLNEVEKANFVRLREISLTYNLPSATASALGIRGGSVSLSGQNLFIFTNYSGVDPESQTYGQGASEANAAQENFGQGIDTYGTPINRRFTMTLRVNI